MRLGFHVQIAGGWRKALERALSRRCSCLQVFTSAPVQWARGLFDVEAAAWFGHSLAAFDIEPLFVHAIYLLNLATGERSLWRRSCHNLTEELHRARILHARGVIVHLGSVGAGGSQAQGLRRVTAAVDEALSRAETDVCVLLENCAGQGNLVGCSPEALGEVIGTSSYPERLGVCIDVAHAFQAGFAVHTAEGLDQFLGACDRAFGLDRLALIHANDSRAPLGSRVDRHWHIGHGHIGRAGFRTIMNEPRLRHLPFIMETPASDEWDRKNMRALRLAVSREHRPALPPSHRLPSRTHSPR